MGDSDVYIPTPIALVLDALPQIEGAYTTARMWAEPIIALHQAVAESLTAEQRSLVLSALSDDPSWSGTFNTAAWRNELLVHLETTTNTTNQYAARTERRVGLDIVDLAEDLALDEVLAYGVDQAKLGRATSPSKTAAELIMAKVVEAPSGAGRAVRLDQARTVIAAVGRKLRRSFPVSESVLQQAAWTDELLAALPRRASPIAPRSRVVRRSDPRAAVLALLWMVPFAAAALIVGAIHTSSTMTFFSDRAETWSVTVDCGSTYESFDASNAASTALGDLKREIGALDGRLISTEPPGLTFDRAADLPALESAVTARCESANGATGGPIVLLIVAAVAAPVISSVRRSRRASSRASLLGNPDPT